jgi:hypothetical protein
MQVCILRFVALTQWCEVQELGLSNVYVVKNGSFVSVQQYESLSI